MYCWEGLWATRPAQLAVCLQDNGEHQRRVCEKIWAAIKRFQQEKAHALRPGRRETSDVNFSDMAAWKWGDGRKRKRIYCCWSAVAKLVRRIASHNQTTKKKASGRPS